MTDGKWGRSPVVGREIDWSHAEMMAPSSAIQCKHQPVTVNPLSGRIGEWQSFQRGPRIPTHFDARPGQLIGGERKRKSIHDGLPDGPLAGGAVAAQRFAILSGDERSLFADNVDKCDVVPLRRGGGLPLQFDKERVRHGPGRVARQLN